MIIKKTFYILILILNIALIGAMFLGKATAWISPEQTTLPTIFGLLFPYLAIINCVFIAFWCFRLKWQAIIPILAMLLFWGELRASFSFFKTSEKPQNAVEIKVMSYNVHYFGYYKNNYSILDYIVQSGADIVCLQEFGYYKNSDQYFSLEKLNEKMHTFPYRSLHVSEYRGERTLGIAIYSKYPIVNEDSFVKEMATRVPFSRNMYADIKIGNDTLRVFNLYLKSNELNRKDKETLFGIVNNFEMAGLDSISNNLLFKIGRTAGIRGKQSKRIAADIAASPYPVIVCGDFNDVPVSYTYHTIGKELNDSFVRSGAGMGITYHENLIRVRIDYLLHSKDIVSSDYHIGKVKYSDHYPVQASFWLKKAISTGAE